MDHFEGVAAVNDWDEDAKLLWMRVRLVGRAQTAYGRLPDSSKTDYTTLKKALTERFEPESKREVYLSEFSIRKKKAGEGWAEYADELRVLADRAFPDLEDKARERLALNQYLNQLDNPQVAFNVRQKRPSKLVDAVSTTLEMESYLLPQPSKVASVEVRENPAVAAVHDKQDTMMGMLQTIMERLDKLEKEVHSKPTSRPPPVRPSTIICHKCGREGHYARGCANPRQSSQPTSKDSVAMVPKSCNFVVSGAVSDLPTKFLVDTGAGVTLLCKDKWDALTPTRAPLKPWTGNPLVGVTGDPLDVWGMTTVEIEIAGEQFHTPMVIASGLTAEAILGGDFLRDNQCSLEIGSRVLRFVNRGVAITLDDASSEPIVVQARVMLAETVHLPPRSEKEAPARIDKPLREGTWILEGDRSGRLPVSVANALVNISSKCVPVRMINTRCESIVIFKGTKVGTVEEAAHPTSVTTVEQSTYPLETKSEKQVLLDSVVKECTEAEGLDPEQAELLNQLLLTNVDLFADDDHPGRTNAIKHRIDTGNSPPIRQPLRRISPHKREEASRLLKDMLDKKIIQPSCSPWESPIVLVPKKDGSVRFCIDYRKVNAVTRRDAYPLPRIDDTLDTLAGSRYFTTLDLVSGYWQVEMAEEDKPKTAFCTPDGLFEFNVLPFGLCNGPATFQRLMDLTLAGLQWSSCLVYLDDIIVVGRSFEEHLLNLQSVFERLRDAGLKLKPKKCAFLKSEVRYLGHVVSREGISTDPAKIDKVADWPIPTCTKEVQQFLGFANYYRRFIREFSQIAKPLHRLTERNFKFKWTPECQQSFEELKVKLTTTPILAYPDYNKPFLLDTDASDVGIGAVLSQRDEEGHEKVVAFASRSLTKAERKYCVTRRELLAVVVFTQHFRPYLLGREFTLRTDHSSLTWLQTFKDPEGQLARWLEKLQQFTFTIVHRQGKKHSNADALSRLPCNQCGREDIATVSHVAHTPPEPPCSTNSTNLREMQLQDGDIQIVLRAIESQKKPSVEEQKAQSLETRRLLQLWDQLLVRDGVLFRQWESADGYRKINQLIMPKSERQKVLSELHEGVTGGHLGEDKVLAKLKERFYWPGHARDVKNWCQTCSACAQRKSPAPRNKAKLQTVCIGYPMQMVSTDILGPFPVSDNGNSYILVATDYFTRWAEAYPIPDQEAATVARKLTDEMFLRFSPPEQLHCDQGRQFESRLLAEVCKLLHIQKSRTTAYHPQSDGLAERWNRTLLGILATGVENRPEDWEDYVRKACMAYNTSVHATTGFTPFFLMFGRQARIPVDLMYGTAEPESVNSYGEYATRLQESLTSAYEIARRSLGKKQERQAELYNKKMHGEPYEVGALVWLLNPQIPRGKSKKLHRWWTGPFKVVKKLSEVTYRIQHVSNRAKRLVVHFDRLKQCNPNVRLDTRHTQQQDNVEPVQQQQRLPSRYEFGTHLEVLDTDETDPVEEQSPSQSHTGQRQNQLRPAPPTPHRYPSRTRRPPDRLFYNTGRIPERGELCSRDMEQ